MAITVTKQTSRRIHLPRLRIRAQLGLLIVVVGALCMLLYQFLWPRCMDVWDFMAHNPHLSALGVLPEPDEDFWTTLYDEAKKYDVPESEEDTGAIEALGPFLALADDYTGLYVYGLEDGMYRAGQYPAVMDSDSFYFLFNQGYRWTGGYGERHFEFPIEFKNGYARVIVNFYHSATFIYPYCLFCFLLCVGLFLGVTLFFVGRKAKAIIRLERNILRMASGDLTTPIPARGHDELGTLARELDNLRAALHRQITQEQEAHRANQELIAALSHDLRTPLTILKGYLEILQLNRTPERQAEN